MHINLVSYEFIFINFFLETGKLFLSCSFLPLFVVSSSPLQRTQFQIKKIVALRQLTFALFCVTYLYLDLRRLSPTYLPTYLPTYIVYEHSLMKSFGFESWSAQAGVVGSLIFQPQTV